jgi:predicted transcriptional regulator
MEENTSLDLLAITADIVAAFVSNNSVPPSDGTELLLTKAATMSAVIANKSSDVFSSIVICSLQKQHNLKLVARSKS